MMRLNESGAGLGTGNTSSTAIVSGHSFKYTASKLLGRLAAVCLYTINIVEVSAGTSSGTIPTVGSEVKKMSTIVSSQPPQPLPKVSSLLQTDVR